MTIPAKRLQFAAATLFLSFAFVTDAAAWGDQGHKVICEIAMRRVSSSTRTEILRLIATDQGATNFADACTWADHPRKRAIEHYLNLPRNAKAQAGDDCGEAPACVLTAIQRDARGLASASSSDGEKLIALRYLGHWVGDIHQPMHVSFKDDRGGNDIRVSGACGLNLHAVWDTCLVFEAVGTDAVVAATILLASLKPGTAETWTISTPREWANETFAIAKNSTTGYCEMTDAACVARAARLQIDRAYIAANTPVVKAQLLKAGIRLAHLLDNALSPPRR